jgi:hypothetical protein
MRQYSLRGIPPHASTKQYLSQQDWQAGTISSNVYDCLGYHFGFNGWISVIWRARCLPLHARLRRSCILRMSS